MPGTQQTLHGCSMKNGTYAPTLPVKCAVTYDPLSSKAYANNCNTNKHIESVQRGALTRLMQAFLREKILSFTQDNNQLVFVLPHTTRAIHIDNVTLGSLDRYMTFGNIYLHEKNKPAREIKHPLEMLDIFKAEIKLSADRKSWEKLSSEIRDHLRNALLSSYKSCEQYKKIIDDAKMNGCTSLLQWLDLQKNVKDKNLFFEQWISRGHPYHPCSKTKLGFSEEDVINYSPEFQPEIPVMIAAVKKNVLHIESMYDHANYETWFAENYPEVWHDWAQALAERQLSADHYSPLPIHPWQLHNVVQALFGDFMADGNLILLEEVSIKSSPTLSFRSLAPIKETQSAYIKLPIAVQATSVFRTLSPGSTENTPKLSRIFHDIFAKEKNFGHRLSILREPYGLHIINMADEHAKNLTAIFRENPNNYLSDDETCIVVAALFEKSPLSGRSLYIELMHAAGVIQLEDAIHYFHTYVDMLLGGYLDMYLLYGVALEGHQQNTLAVFRHGSITRFIARDFDGTNIHANSLRERGYAFQEYPGSTTLKEDMLPVRNHMLHTVYQSHLGELVLLLAQHFQCDEHHFWRVIKDVTEQRFASLQERVDVRVWNEEYHAILQASWPCKALLRMRLQQKFVPGGIFYDIENPLAGLSETQT